MRNTRLLEKRVHQAVERLKQLSEDRRRLEDELRSVRGQLEEARKSDHGQHEWAARRTQLEALVRDTLTELSAD